MENLPMLTDYQVAERLNVSVATVRRWRLLKQGPRFIKVSGSAVRYFPTDVTKYLDTRPTGGGHQAEAR